MNQIKDVTKEKEFKYKKIASYETKLNCISFTFNVNQAILFVGCRSGNIFAFGFKQKLKMIQLLKQHKLCVTCLVFQKKTNQLISGSDDKLIIIWNKEQYSQWAPHQILSNHTDNINCLLVSQKQDLIISGGVEKAIKFLGKKNQSWHCLQTVKLQFKVICISLNFSEKKLISLEQGGWLQAITVIECQSLSKWVITQKINFNECALRLVFINDNQFYFQAQQNSCFVIYNFQKEKKQFVRSDYSKLQEGQGWDSQYYFPPQFIRQNNLLVSKHGKWINCFKIDQNGCYFLKQSIQFQDSQLFGRLTDDRQQLVTWDSTSKKIQTFIFIFVNDSL